ncbi:Targeting protein for Xklp2-like protein [Phytophthora ramorum]|uniref:Targeting protein for Xklp2-like protein n=1 Tax=Phytophthora ramorum TaxID=164328 RepID=UPI0030B53637|nr:Targeting protein for Xklp2-like protein [Phytophthora ramorum]
MATLLDTTMAESEHAQVSEPETDAAEEDDDFCFDAPSYYDLKNPSLERRYVNNADGYFSSPATSRSAPSPGFSTTTESTVAASHKEIDNNEPKDMQDTTMTEEELDVQQVLSNSRLLDDKEESFEEVFRHYASSSQSSATSSYLLHELDTSTHSSQTSSSSTPLRMEHKSRFSTADGTSKLMQPTQSYLRRMQAEQRVREQTFMEDVPMQDKPRVTRPRSPKLHTRSRPANPNDPSRMSSTSRELLKIQEERLHLQLEKLKIREFHEKTKVQRPPSNVHQRSTKQLTIPQTPHFEVDSRVRRLHSERTETGQDKTPIAAEKLLSRDFALPLPPHSRETRHPRTIPQSPQLHTATRASQRPPPAPLSREKPPAPSYSRSKSGGLTQPVTPQLETSRRAATHRRPIEVVDHDAEELAKKFHARPLNKNILEPKSYPRYSPAKSDSKARLTQHAAPKSTTTARSVTRQSASEPAASVASELERRRKEREQRMKARQTGQTTQQKSGQPSIRRPVIPETPPLKSIQLHREYQENFRRRIEAEEEEKEKQRTFKAKPMRVTSTPARFEGSTKPLTEMKPFELPGDRYREHASERLEQKRREEEEHLQSAGTFRAKPMPVFEADSFQVSSSSRPLTHTESPMLATNRRAAERAAFEAAEKERREQEEAFRQQRELLERQLEEEEVKRMRRKDMIFHARPVPESKPFQLKHDVTPLTEPVSPIKHS